ncbi:cytochrome P450 monooxygenase-like protein [Hypoxylon rubiginosum]|uniref:Cytochrome P450 monooxygenase-like protein n=1 Tax=Hypoxylon rubiginosum TaxID=110542 RepID=A0ACC0D4Z0_9PEZI|nr:cytochrome P450 monooxygenase-like protein [Hypoxylon rubiginosum]
MFDVSFDSIRLSEWLALSFALCFVLIFTNSIYNLFFHPLSGVPGPFWGRVSPIPSWYYACRGDRHIWLWKQFQRYGKRIRPDPNTVLFCDSQAYSDIYSARSNVRRSRFYEAFQEQGRVATTLMTIDVAEHAAKRKRLNVCFTEKSVRAASDFIVNHVDRWIDIILEENKDVVGWSSPVDFTEKVDALIFDIMGDLSFGRSFDIKEPGENPVKRTPHSIAAYLRFVYPMLRFPYLNLLLWLKPRGIDQFLSLIVPPDARRYSQFVDDCVANRIALQKEQSTKPEAERRQDMFYFLAEARDPDTGLPAYDDSELWAESSMLIVAGSDTTAVSLSGIFFYLTGDPQRYQKLVDEIRSTFGSVEEIVHGSKLSGCTYLRACVDEGMRLTPTGPSELPREVLPGGLRVMGEYYPPGTIVGTSPWVSCRSQEVFGDAESFRPERWILNESAGVTKDSIARGKSAFRPFLSGPTNCAGQNLAIAEMLITIAQTLYRLDVRRAPGSTLGGGSPELGWGQNDKNQFQLVDAYISLRQGPEVQFRKRMS